MKKIIGLTIFLTFTIWSCEITKQASKNKTHTDYKEQWHQKETRQGDTATFKPVLNIKYIDTTIYRTTVQGTILKTTYDKQGNVSNIDCISSAIELLTTMNKEFNQQSKEKESEKAEKFNTTWFLYLIIGIVILGIVAVIIIMKSVNKNSSAITSLINALNNRNLDNKI